jgi:hypothetical protein
MRPGFSWALLFAHSVPVNPYASTGALWGALRVGHPYTMGCMSAHVGATLSPSYSG